MPNDAAGRYGPADDAGYQGFHTYATSDLYDTNGGAERWPDNWAGQHPEAAEDLDDDDDPAARRDYWTVLLWTVGWYGAPLLILLLRALILSGDPDAACSAAGIAGCSSPRADALGDLISNAPIWLFAVVCGIMLALVLRWASDTWRAATIGFCAAVVSGGAVTVLYGIW